MSAFQYIRAFPDRRAENFLTGLPAGYPPDAASRLSWKIWWTWF